MAKDWKKDEKEIYLPKAKPELVDIKEFNYICLDGEGNPNDSIFSEKISALFAIAYGIKMGLKTNERVYPLEGLWTFDEIGVKAIEEGTFIKEHLVYKVMIRVPDFVDNEVLTQVKASKAKKKLTYLNAVYLEKICDGRAVQILHNGSFDSEPISFSKIAEFLKTNNLERRTMMHREIYLSDSRKTALDKLKTVLRVLVK